MRLETERFIVRKVELKDVDDIFEITSDEEVVSMVGWSSHNDINDTAELVKNLINDDDTYSILEKDKSKVVGTIGVHKKPANSNLDVRMLAIILNKKYWGGNIAYEVTIEILKYLFEVKKVHKVNVGHFSFNKQSQRVIEKLGFVYEGTKREVIIHNGSYYDALEYSMLMRDYKSYIYKEEV